MEGYSAIAQIMGNHDELAIVRRFRELNVQDLLYSQAEVIHLEAELAELREMDKIQPDRAIYSRDWWSLAHSEEDRNKEQWAKVLEIRHKLREYSACSYSQPFSS
jgi:hypothetical protein